MHFTPHFSCLAKVGLKCIHWVRVLSQQLYPVLFTVLFIYQYWKFKFFLYTVYTCKSTHMTYVAAHSNYFQYFSLFTCICFHLGISQCKMRDTFPFNLHDELKKHLVQGKKERKHIVANPGLFQVVFSCFQNFEVSVKQMIQYNMCWD